MIFKTLNSIKINIKNFLNNNKKDIYKILYKIKFNFNTKNIHKMIL